MAALIRAGCFSGRWLLSSLENPTSRFIRGWELLAV
jgi:hypothetical protein